jgi:hypothetical protein
MERKGQAALCGRSGRGGALGEDGAVRHARGGRGGGRCGLLPGKKVKRDLGSAEGKKVGWVNVRVGRFSGLVGRGFENSYSRTSLKGGSRILYRTYSYYTRV